MATVLVTGGAGFIGSHVVDLLLAQGHAAVVLDDLSTGRLANLPADVPVLRADIGDERAVRQAAAELPPLSGVIHCAAQASVVVSTRDPLHDLLVNVGGTIRMLDLAEHHACPLVFTSTGGAIYGTRAARPTPESAEIEPGAPYGASKAAAELYVELSARRSGLPHAICRLGNVYGPRQRGDGEAGVVAIFAERLRSGEPVTLYGDGAPTRDYVHVEDVAEALLAALGTAGTFNVATGVETSVRDVLALEQQVLQAEVDVQLAPLRPGELPASCLDVSHAERALGWRPRRTVADGIPATAQALVAA